MILSKYDIDVAIYNNDIQISNLTEESFQPASLDLRLGTSFAKVERNDFNTLDTHKEVKSTEIVANSYTIPAHSFVLATTVETVKISTKITAWLEGRSSVGRCGIFVQNAGWIDPGFSGELTLELYNCNDFPVKIYAGDRVCQIVFSYLETPAPKYDGKYNGQKGATSSRICEDEERM